MRILLISLLVAATLTGCSKREKIVVGSFSGNLKAEKLEDVTGKKMQDIKIKTDHEGEFDNINWTFTKKFSKDDIALARLAVLFMEKLTGLSYNCDYQNIYWSDDMLTSMGTNGSLLGMTVFKDHRAEWRAYIAISTSLKPPSPHDLNAMRDFGSTVIHECLHAGNLDIEATVRAKIERPIDMSFDLYCAMTVSNFYAFKLDRFTNKPYGKMIEKVAYESGIKAPWHYSRDYIGDPIRPVIQVLMLPEPTNHTTTNLALPPLSTIRQTNIQTTNALPILGTNQIRVYSTNAPLTNLNVRPLTN